jgi:hypothetical protein
MQEYWMENKKMDNKTGQIIDALGINRIYWIDDKFFNGHEYTEHAISHSIVTLISKGGPLPDELDRFNGYMNNCPDESALLQEVTGFLDDLEAEGKGQEVEKIHAALGLMGAIEEEDALTNKGYEELEELFVKTKPIKLSFSDWDEQKAELETGDKVLFLIDYENKIDSKAPTVSGEQVLRELAAKDSPPFSIVLTHVCQPNEELAKAAEIFEKIKGKSSDSIRRFSLMSKRRIAEASDITVDDAIAPPFKRLAINQMYRRIAESCYKGMIAGLDDGISSLNDLPVHDIEHAIFARSSEEGISEPEVISRILGIFQRKSFFSGIKALTTTAEENYFRPLTSLRNVQNVSIQVDDISPVHETLVALRHAELFDDGDFINPLCSPLACGDVFQKWSDDGYNGAQYLFLAPPCDLMVRDNGARSASEGFLVLLKWKELDDTQQSEASSVPERSNDEKSGKRYEIPVGTPGASLIADFYTSTTVNLRVMDFCVSNVLGEVKFRRKGRLPFVLLGGWRKRFEDAQSVCQTEFPPRYTTLCMFADDFSGIREGQMTGKDEIDFKLKRVKRIRSPYAEAILKAYLESIGRPAFDHSFAERRGGE